MLPIQLSEFVPEQWKAIEKRLIAIANQEKEELEPCDQVVRKILATVQYAAKNKRWNEVSARLIERNIIKIKTAKSEIPKPIKPKAKPIKPKKKRFKLALPEILYSDFGLGIGTIANRANDLGIELNDRVCQEYLKQFAREGLIYQVVGIHKYTAYALSETDAIDPNEWLPASIIYRIATQRGYKHSYNYFKSRPYIRTQSQESVAAFYAKYGIEYKFEYKPGDNLRWRLINDIS